MARRRRARETRARRQQQGEITSAKAARLLNLAPQAGVPVHQERKPLFRHMLLGLGIATLLALALGSTAAAQSPGPEEKQFLARSDAAMARMMAAMKITPSGDVDRDFVALMVPHHQGAIDMAEAELSYGHNESLRRLAQEIIVTQQQEIAAMRLAEGEPLPPSVPPSNQPTTSSRHTLSDHLTPTP